MAVLRKVKLAAKEHIRKQQERTKEHWLYKPTKACVIVISIMLMFFFNADGIWKGIQLYETTEKQHSSLEEAIIQTLKEDYREKAAASKKVLRYFLGDKNTAKIDAVLQSIQ